LGGLTGAGAPQSQNPLLQQIHSINNAVAILFPSAPANNVGPPANYGAAISPTGDNGTGVSESLISFIKSWEGFVGTPYVGLDTENQTVGYGHVVLSTDSFTYPLTLAQGDALLRSDLTARISSVQSKFK
jgi:hypothetical protein